MRFKISILFFILLAYSYSYTGSSSRYGYSARSFSLADAMIADKYHTFQSFSNPSSLNQCNGTNYGISFFNIVKTALALSGFNPSASANS